MKAIEEAKDKINKALEVLSWCQENADEKWMVDHLTLVRTDITQALAKLREAPEPTKFTKMVRKDIKDTTPNLYASIIWRACDIIEQQATDLADIKLELSCPETMECANNKEPLYKWAALIMCIKHQQTKQIKQLQAQIDKQAKTIAGS